MPSKIDRIELYHKHCYSCDRFNDFGTLRQFIITERLPLDTLVIKRIETDPEWQEEAKNIGLDLPFLRITMKNGEVVNINYDEWVNKLTKKKVKRPRKKIITKKTVMTTDDVATKDIEEDGR